MIYPTITNYTFGMFNCTEVEGVYYLVRDIEIECWSHKHTYILLAYTVPPIIVWVFGFPLLICYLLYKSRSNLNNKDTIMKYGLYYVGFKDKSFFWYYYMVYFTIL
jgi:hypothetical protein